MPRFSSKSLDKLSTCAPALQRIAGKAIEQVDFSVIWGHRSKSRQDMFFKEGYSKVEWPRSKHNKLPSRAIDLAPWPVNWDDRERFFFLAGVILSIAREKKIALRWGGAWSGSFNEKGRFDDLAHFELFEE